MQSVRLPEFAIRVKEGRNPVLLEKPDAEENGLNPGNPKRQKPGF
jgi:hypothetical protein